MEADEVENLVLVARRDQLPKQPILLACISPHSLRLGRVVPVLPVGPPAARQSLSGTRAGAQPTVPGSDHCALLGLGMGDILFAARPAARSSVGQLQVGLPLVLMRFTGHFRTCPPRAYAPPFDWLARV